MVPKIIAEEYIGATEEIPIDYKVLCFDGQPRLIEVHANRFTDEHVELFYDTDWNKCTYQKDAYKTEKPYHIARPTLLQDFLYFSSILAKDIPHVRVDWYEVNGRLYFGEMTFFDGSGCSKFDKEEDEMEIGSWIRLPR